MRGEEREGIRALLTSFQRFPFAFHRITNPIIKVDGDTATGAWYVQVPITLSAKESRSERCARFGVGGRPGVSHENAQTQRTWPIHRRRPGDLRWAVNVQRHVDLCQRCASDAR